MNRREFAARALAPAASALLPRTSPAQTKNPNIVVILLDDMGYSDIGCFGGEIQTPNVDRMAAAGVRFTQFYNTARCCPSRATIMTGLYAHQAGVGAMEADWGLPAYQGHLKRGLVTLPETLRQHGYRTIMSGKWHLGTAQPDLPWARGFDRFYGIPQGGGVYFWPTPLDRDLVLYNRDDGKGPVVTKPDESFYSTDAFGAYAARQIHQAHQDRTPFFLYVPFVAPHFPHQAWEKDIRKYLGRYREGWDKLRSKRYQRQVKMGIIDPKHRLSPGDSMGWDSLSDTQKTALDRQMAVYAAQIDNMDQNVGRILGALRDTGASDNTLVLFLSDNGGQRNGPLGSDRNPEAPFGSRNSFGQYAHGWANLSNTPFRRYKSEEHEGGNATPLIVHWPAALRQSRGRITHQPGHIIDIVPTCLDAAGLDPQTAEAHGATQRMEGISLLPFCRRQLPEQSRTLCWEHEGNRAIRIGDWKLVALRGGEWELYHLAEDRTELHNRAGTLPERVQQMEAEYRKWADRCGVLPWPVKRAHRDAGYLELALVYRMLSERGCRFVIAPRASNPNHTPRNVQWTEA